MRKPETARELRTKDDWAGEECLKGGPGGSIFQGSQYPAHLSFKAEKWFPQAALSSLFHPELKVQNQ